MDRSRRLLSVVATWLLSGVVAACGSGGSAGLGASSSASAAAKAQASTGAAASVAPLNPRVPIKIGTLGQPAEIGNYLAIERGYFAAEGLDASLVPFGNSPDEISPLFSNELQFAVGQPSGAFFNAAARDVGLKFITTMANYAGSTRAGAIAVRTDLVDGGRYKEPKDLKGMSIGQIGPAGATQMYIERAVEKAGLARTDVNLVVLGAPEAVAALGNQKIDASFLFEPFMTTAEDKSIAKRMIPVGQLVAPGSPAGLVMVSADYASKQPEVVKRYVTAHLRGQRDYYNAFYANLGSRDDIFQVLAKDSALKDVSLISRIEPNVVDPNGNYDPEELSLMQDFFMRVGVQKDKVPLEKMVDRSYIDYALQRLGKV